MDVKNIKPIFTKEIDLSNKNDMVEFLAKHPRYWTMNGWNELSSYAQNVKLHNLRLPEDISEKAYDFIDAECETYNEQLHMLLSEFTLETGYFADFNGRSGGYIVLYDSVREPDTGKLRVSNASIDSDCTVEDFAERSMSNLRERVELVTRFDKLCDDIRALFIESVRNCELIPTTYYKPESRLIAVLPDNKANDENTDAVDTDDENDLTVDLDKKTGDADLPALTAEQEERVYRNVLHRYHVQDANEHVNNEIRSIVGDDALSRTKDIDYLAGLPEIDYQNALKLYSLSIADFKAMATVFEDNYDCNVDENSQWENLVTDYIDNIDFDELIAELRETYDDYLKSPALVEKKTYKAYSAYCEKQKAEKPGKMPLTYNEYVAEYGLTNDTPDPSFNIFMQNDYFEFMRSR